MKSTMKLMIAALVVVALLAVPAMARSGSINNITAGDVVFVYEQNLNVSLLTANLGPLNSPPTSFRKFANDQPNPNAGNYAGLLSEIAVNPSVGGLPGTLSIQTAPAYMGIWFPYNASAGFFGVNPNNSIQIQHADVTLDGVLANSHTDSIAGKSVTRDTKISFKLVSNYAGNYYKFTPALATGEILTNVTYAAPVNIELTTPGGGKIQVFGNNNTDLRNIVLVGSVMYTDTLPGGSGNFTPAVVAGTQSPFGQPIDLTNVEAGTYTATAKWVQNNPVVGAALPWYNLESNSNAVTFTVLSKPITITTNKESVVRGNTFVVTITGESKKNYWVYMKDSSVSSGYFYPVISVGQSNVNGTIYSGYAVPAATFGATGGTNTGAGVLAPISDINTVFNNTAFLFTQNQTAALVTTAADGTRGIQFETTSKTYDTKFTIKVMDPTDRSKYDTVDVSVEKGQVTITYEGTGTYYLGETIKLTGTNTDSDNVYLYLVGPNLYNNGVSLADISVQSVSGLPATFKEVGVNTDNTWSYKWDTSQLTVSLDAGTYTIYAAAQPQTKDNLTSTQYNTASVVLKKPFVTASASAATLAKGDILYIRGIAEGKPNNVYVWTFGKNYRDCQEAASVKSDASYEYKMDRGATSTLYPGQYFVVVQHPMMNGIADIVGPGGVKCLWAQPAQASSKTTANSTPVRISGLQASDAATAVVDMLNSPDIDDTYTKLSFMIEEPWLRIDTIGDKYVGETFKITGTTNLAEGDQILMTVTSSSFQPTEKTQTGEFSGSSGTVTVQKGDTYNTFSYDVDASTFKPDEYLVKAESVEPSQTTTATFNVLEGKPTTVPTTERTPVFTPPPTTVATPPPTTVVPTTTAKPQPGFGALVALVGLGAVALLVLRRR
jgi:PGF-CTERM protein